jgi:hypothetical protein
MLTLREFYFLYRCGENVGSMGCDSVKLNRIIKFTENIPFIYSHKAKTVYKKIGLPHHDLKSMKSGHADFVKYTAFAGLPEMPEKPKPEKLTETPVKVNIPKVKTDRLRGKTFFSKTRIVVDGQVIHTGWMHPEEREKVLTAIENNGTVFSAYLFFAFWMQIQPAAIDWLIRVGFFKTL